MFLYTDKEWKYLQWIYIVTMLAIWAVMIFACSTTPAVAPCVEEDPLKLQHQLGHSIDSIDSLWGLCQAPKGCTCINGVRYCPDIKPDAPQ